MHWPAMPLLRRIALVTAIAVTGRVAGASEHFPSDYHQLTAPQHRYWERTPRDRFFRLKSDLETGRVILDSGSEREFLEALLKELEIPVSSQILVFSSTSLQTSLISPTNPRAIYFNEDVYVGYIPRGRIEVIGLDPELGAMFYIFDIPRGENAPPPVIDRSNRCMNCHAGAETGRVPGLLVESVIPGPNRGSLVGFRGEEVGHHVAYSERFGGWYLTGFGAFTNHWANLTGRLVAGELIPIPVSLETGVDLSRYPVGTSDILAHLVHEHQAGFVNRVVEAAYRARTILHSADGVLTDEESAELDRQARRLVRYILFANEPPLPEGIRPDSAYQEAFLKDRRTDSEGRSLRDLDLQTRLFRRRCSYMIYSPLINHLPGDMKRRLFLELKRALGPEAPAEFAYLPETERQEIREILTATLNDPPAEWR